MTKCSDGQNMGLKARENLNPTQLLGQRMSFIHLLIVETFVSIWNLIGAIQQVFKIREVLSFPLLPSLLLTLCALYSNSSLLGSNYFLLPLSYFLSPLQFLPCLVLLACLQSKIYIFSISSLLFLPLPLNNICCTLIIFQDFPLGDWFLAVCSVQMTVHLMCLLFLLSLWQI